MRLSGLAASTTSDFHLLLVPFQDIEQTVLFPLGGFAGLLHFDDTLGQDILRRQRKRLRR